MSPHQTYQEPTFIPTADQFTLSNQTIIGVWADLLEDDLPAAANAWSRAHALFSVVDRETEQPVHLVVIPADRRDQTALANAKQKIESSLQRRSGFHTPSNGGWSSTTLVLDLYDADLHPGPARHAQLIDALNAASDATTDDTDREKLIALRDILNTARVGRAQSESWGQYDVIIMGGADDDQLTEVANLVRDVSTVLFGYSKSVSGGGRVLDAGLCLNNSSPVVTDDIARKLLHAPDAISVSPLAVGVITPGGPAAPYDVIGKLERIEEIELHRQVVPRNSTNLNKAMIRAADTLFDCNPKAVVVGYGGGRDSELDEVFAALESALGQRQVPMYIGIGHRNYAKRISSDFVRMCATPSDAADLFRIEAIEIPRNRAKLTAQAAEKVAKLIGDPSQSAEVATELTNELTKLDKELQTAQDQHLQPTSSVGAD